MINIIKIARRFELRKSRNYQPTLGEEDYWRGPFLILTIYYYFFIQAYVRVYVNKKKYRMIIR